MYAAENMCMLTCRFSVWNSYSSELLGTCVLLILFFFWQTCLGRLRDRVANGGDPTKLHEPPAEHNISNADEGTCTSILLIGLRRLSMIPNTIEWLFVWMLLTSKHIFDVFDMLPIACWLKAYRMCVISRACHWGFDTMPFVNHSYDTLIWVDCCDYHQYLLTLCFRSCNTMFQILQRASMFCYAIRREFGLMFWFSLISVIFWRECV